MWALALWRPSRGTQPLSAARHRRLIVPLAASLAVATSATAVVVWGQTGAMLQVGRAALVWSLLGLAVGLVFGLAGRALRWTVCAALAIVFGLAAILWTMTGSVLADAPVGELVVELAPPNATGEPSIRSTVCAADDCAEPLVSSATEQIAVRASVLDHSGALWPLPGPQRAVALAIHQPVEADEPAVLLVLSRNRFGDRIAQLLTTVGPASIRSVSVDLAPDRRQYVQPGRYPLFMPDSF